MSVDPYLLLLGVIAITTCILLLTRSLCHDPERMLIEAQREREQEERAFAAIMVAQMNPQELQAFTTGQAPGLFVRRGGALDYRRGENESNRGVDEVTRSTFLKLVAGPGNTAMMNISPTAIGLVSTPKSKTTKMLSNENSDDLPERGASRQSSSRRVLSGNGDGYLRPYSDQFCAICLEEYTAGDQLLQLTCAHTFHADCVEPWLQENCSCPCCRTNLGHLALVSQLFPQAERKALQKALADTGGSSMAAIELLLSSPNPNLKACSSPRNFAIAQEQQRTHRSGSARGPGLMQDLIGRGSWVARESLHSLRARNHLSAAGGDEEGLSGAEEGMGVEEEVVVLEEVVEEEVQAEAAREGGGDRDSDLFPRPVAGRAVNGAEGVEASTMSVGEDMV